VAYNLIVDLADERFDERAVSRAHESAAARGYRLQATSGVDDRLAAWIDWQFAPSWWSAEARAGSAWYALDGAGEICGFAAFDARGLPFPWLRDVAREPGVGIFGPFGVCPPDRKTGLGDALLRAALASLRARGYSRALIPAVGFDRLATMYETRVGARIVETFSYASPTRFRATILASGGGTNAQSVFDRVAAGQLALDIVGLVSNVAGAPVVERAAAAGIAATSIVWQRAAETRAAYDARVIAAVAATEPDLVLLLGWMHLLPPAFIDRFGDILNVHPAFLPFDPHADDVVMPDGARIPAFRGAHALRDALTAGVGWTGASVHRVTAEIDRGAIMVRTPVRLDASRDNVDVLEMLRPVEHAAVNAAIRRWIFERNAQQTPCP
jgi:phosphoribosylglycinamide formyltransferase-1